MTVEHSILSTKAFVALHLIFGCTVAVYWALTPDAPTLASLAVIVSNVFAITSGIVTIRGLRRYTEKSGNT